MKFSDDLWRDARQEYPNMDVIQEQDYIDGNCNTLEAIVIVPADAIDETVATCNFGSMYYRYNTELEQLSTHQSVFRQ